MILRKPAFVPSMISGCALWVRTDKDIYTDVGRKFHGPGQYLGNDSYIYTGNFSNYTVAFWVYPYNVLNTTSMVSYRSTSDANMEFFHIYQEDGTPFMQVRDAANSRERCDGAGLTTNAWNHVIGTWNGSQALLYINNTNPIDSEPNPSVTPGIPVANALTIGATTNGSITRSQFFSGVIQGVSIWPYVLNSTERTYIYNSAKGRIYSQLTGSLASPVSYYPLGERFGQAYDFVPQTATSYNQPLYASGNPVAGSGKLIEPCYLGSALSLWRDGTGRSNDLRGERPELSFDYTVDSGNLRKRAVADGSFMSCNRLSGLFFDSNRSYTLFVAGRYTDRNPLTTYGTLMSATSSNEIIAAGLLTTPLGGHVYTGILGNRGLAEVDAAGRIPPGMFMCSQTVNSGVITNQTRGYRTNSTSMSVPNISVDRVGFGATMTGASPNSFFSGYFYEMVLYDGALGLTDHNHIIDYLAYKWDLVPLKYSGLNAWYDARSGDDLIPYRIGASNEISGWRSSYNTDQTSISSRVSNFPRVGTGSINGYNSLYFNGVSTTGPVLSGVNTDLNMSFPMTFFVVAKRNIVNTTAGSAIRPMIINSDADNNTAVSPVMTAIPGQPSFDAYAATRPGMYTILNPSGSFPVGVPKILYSELRDGFTRIAINRNQFSVASGIPVGLSLAVGFHVGGGTAFAPRKFAGDIGEIIYCKGGMTSGMRYDIEDYLSRKWDIPREGI
jgi:hypothetical protein